MTDNLMQTRLGQLSQDIEQCLCKHRHGFRLRLRKLQALQAKGAGDEPAVTRLSEAIKASMAVCEQRRRSQRDRCGQ